MNQIRLTLSVTAPSFEGALELLLIAAKDAMKTKGKDAKPPEQQDCMGTMWGHIARQRFSWLTVEPHYNRGYRELPEFRPG
jgi:hypothetical protein